MYISPNRIILRHKPYSQWEIDEIINLFYSRVDGWHLEVADRCINGWKDEDGNEHINARHLSGTQANYIPDSGWAALQISLNYFETIGYFIFYSKKGKKTSNTKIMIETAFQDIFSEHDKSLSDHIYDLRNEIHHQGLNSKSKVVLRHTMETKEIEKKGNILIIDPHKFIPRLRKHLHDYYNNLLNHDNKEQREIFHKAFIEHYGKRYYNRDPKK